MTHMNLRELWIRIASRLSPVILAVLCTPAVVSAQVVDLNNLDDYASQPVPPYITRDNTPLSNPITDAGATLGRILFYDVRLSANDTVSCASCHLQERGFGDDAVASVGVNGTTGRHSMRLVNARFADETNFFWDERAPSLESQVTEPIRDHVEMGFSGEEGAPNMDDLLDKLAATAEYPALFEFVFGDDAVTEERMQLALAQFIRSIQSFDSRYDAGRAQVPNDGVPFPNFSVAENNGKSLFLTPAQFNGAGQRIGGGVGCAACHRPPEFDISPFSRNNGLISSFSGEIDIDVTRSPSLRDMLDSNGNAIAGLMHTSLGGPGASVDVVLGFYNSGIQTPPANTNLDPRLTPNGNPQRLNLTPVEVNELNAFLRTLTGSNVYVDPKWASPFAPDGSLTILGLPVFADLNGDGVVDTADLGILIALFGRDDAIADLNDDGIVDTADLGIMIGRFGATM